MNIAAPCFSISGVARAQDSTIKSDSDFVKTPIVVASIFFFLCDAKRSETLSEMTVLHEQKIVQLLLARVVLLALIIFSINAVDTNLMNSTQNHPRTMNSYHHMYGNRQEFE